MIFYFNANGTLKSFVPEKVYQGSQKVNSVYFLSPVPSSSVVVAHFVLQDGSEIEPHVLSLVKDFCCEQTNLGVSHVNVWEAELTTAITERYGNVKVNFAIENAYQEKIVTQVVVFQVEKGVVPKEVEKTDTYAQLIQYVAGVNLDCNRLMGEVDELNQALNDKIDGNQLESVKEELYQTIEQSASEQDEKISSLQTTLLSIAAENEMYTISTVSDDFSSRKVAGGLNVIDKTPCAVKEIEGYTNVDDSTKGFVNANVVGFSCTGKNLLNLEDRYRPAMLYTSSDKRDFSNPYFSLEDTAGNAFSVENMIEFVQEGSSLTWESNYMGYGLGISLEILPQTTYYYSYINVSFADKIAVSYFDKEGVFIKNVDLTASKSFTTPASATNAVLVITNSDFSADTVSIKDLYVGFTESEYEPYKKSSASFSLPVSLGMGEKIDIENKVKKNYSVVEKCVVVANSYVQACSGDWQDQDYFSFYVINGISKNSVGQKNAAKSSKVYEKYYLAYNQDGVFTSTGYLFQLPNSNGKNEFVDANSVVVGIDNDRTVYLKISNSLLGITNEQTNQEKIQAAIQYLAEKPIMVRYVTAEVQSSEPFEVDLSTYLVYKNGLEKVDITGKTNGQNSSIGVIADYYTLTRGDN